jgi:DNA-binding PucR family transcriptional regulator
VSRLSTLIGAGAIGTQLDEIACVLVPGAGARRTREVQAAVERIGGQDGMLAALGPTTSLGEAPVSFARARAALALRRAGILPAEGLTIASEHLLTLMLHCDPSLTAELAARRLGPLQALVPVARERLEQTLLAWLRHGGNVPAAAAELHVHRQTVRYRLGSLRELFGEALDDPDRRLELELALRGRRSESS